MSADAASDLIIGLDGLARPRWAAANDAMRVYHDTEWGMPVRDERGVFERISLEAFQAGLSWATILRKREALRRAFADFDPDAVAAYTESDVERLMADARIVRSRPKITATIANARATVELRAESGLAEFVWSFRPAPLPPFHRLSDVPTQLPESAALAKALRARGFRFVGPTTMFALMEAIGMVNTHLVGSFRNAEIPLP